MVNIDPILLVPLVGDLVMGIVIARNALHAKLGVYDIGYVVEPLGEKSVDGKQMYQVRARVEFNPGNKKFRLGRGKAAETYRIESPTENEINRIRAANAKKKGDLQQVPEPPKDDIPGPGFLQWTHRVWFFTKGKAYPISIGMGKPARNTTARGMDMMVTQSLWGQAVASLKKMSAGLPAAMVLMSFIAGAGIAAMAFFIIHPGFVPIGTQIAQHTTATFTGTNSTTVVGFHQ